MSDDENVIDVEFTEVGPKPTSKLIWADRIAVGLGLIGILIGVIHATMYDPAANLAFIDPAQPLPNPDRFGDFLAISIVALSFVGVLWLVLRIIDFVFTGRVRH